MKKNGIPPCEKKMELLIVKKKLTKNSYFKRVLNFNIYTNTC